MSAQHAPLTTAAPLLDALAARGPHPVLAWYGEGGRVELSGQVLAGWVIKAIGHLDAEIVLSPGDLVVLDMPPHWKRTVMALACWALGAEVRIAGPAAPGTDAGSAADDARVLVTDRPEQAPSSVEEVLAIAPVSLAMRFDGELPPLVHDWVQEVRSAPDHLAVPLPRWSGPTPADGTEVLALSGDGLEPDEAARALLGTLLGEGRLVGPRAALDEAAAQAEGIG